MKMATVRGGLPDGAEIGLWIAHREAQGRAVGRPAQVAGRSCDGQELARITGVAVGEEYVVSQAVRDALTIRRPGSAVGHQIAQSTRRTAKNRDGPKRAVERRAVSGVHQ